MKTLQQNTGLDRVAKEGDFPCETHLWNDKSAKDVLREAYHDNCVIKPVTQPKSTSTTVSRPTTYIVYDRSKREDDEDDGESIGTLVELP